MTTFTIDTDNNITAFAALSGRGRNRRRHAAVWQLGGAYAVGRWLARGALGCEQPAGRDAGAKGFKNPKAAASKIWGRIQNMAEPEQPIDAAPKAERKPKGGAPGR